MYRLALKQARRIYLETRSWPADFVNKVNAALGETMETQVWLHHARTCDYIGEEAYEEMDERRQYIGAMLRRMIQRADGFCHSREE